MAHRSTDPFDFDLSIVPPGMIYQWCGKTVLDSTHPDFIRMVEGGWRPVPAHRHPTAFRRSAIDADGNISVGGQVLMCRLAEVSQEAHQLNEDAAHRNAQAAARLIRLDDIPIAVSDAAMRAANEAGISARQYALGRLKRMAEGRDPDTHLRRDAVTGNLVFGVDRRPRHPWLRWLFNLISTEK